MQYVEGESLRQRLARTGPLPLDEAIRVATQVLGALDYAHAHGVVHRDIKPENILLESDHAVVADFGVARAVSAAGDERLTGTGTVQQHEAASVDSRMVEVPIAATA
jgi:serine/threonine-protein kinase